jgi:hypothetical protein
LQGEEKKKYEMTLKFARVTGLKGIQVSTSPLSFLPFFNYLLILVPRFIDDF